MLFWGKARTTAPGNLFGYVNLEHCWKGQTLKVTEPWVTDEYLGSIPSRRMSQHLIPVCPSCSLCHSPSRENSRTKAAPVQQGQMNWERTRGHPEHNGQSLSPSSIGPLRPGSLFHFLFWFVWFWYNLNNVVKWCRIPNLLLILKTSTK